jgi:hypothetical protein
MVDPFTIAGVTISGLNLATTWGKLFKDFLKWEEKDLPINMGFVSAAIEAGRLDGSADDYAFMREDKIPTAELKKDAEVVFAPDEKKRIRYRLTVEPRGAGPRLVLVRKLPK